MGMEIAMGIPTGVCMGTVMNPHRPTSQGVPKNLGHPCIWRIARSSL